MLSYVSPMKCSLHNDNGIETKKRWFTLDNVLKRQLGPSWTPLRIRVLEHVVAKAITRVHSSNFVQDVKIASVNKKALCSPDVQMNIGSFTAARAAVKACIKAVKAISKFRGSRKSDASELAMVFCNVRPPGHHSGHDHTHGFCVFNQAAIASFYAIEHHPMTFRHVAIFDWDIHVGDKTVDILRKNQVSVAGRISYYSIHQTNIFPYEKQFNEERSDSNNIYLRGLPLGCTIERYMETFQELLEIMRKQKPDLVVISCGFDSCSLESMGEFPLLPKNYAEMTRALRDVCPNIVSILEGGYELDSMATCLQYHLLAAQASIRPSPKLTMKRLRAEPSPNRYLSIPAYTTAIC